MSTMLLGSVRRPSWARLATNALLVLGAGLLLPRLAAFAQIVTTLVAWQWQFDFDEGINLNATLLLAHGVNIYAPNGPDQFISAPYTPFYYLLNAPFTWLTGPSFGVGRALTLLSTLAIAGLLGYIVVRITGRGAAGLLAGALWLSLSPVIVWGALYKQDMLALAFGLAGLAWALRYPTGQRSYVALAFFVLAFYTKQSAASAAAATTLWLLARDGRAGLRFGVALAAAIGVPFLVFDRLLYGGFWEHVIGNQSLPWTERFFRRSLGRLWGEHWPLLLWDSGVLVGLLAAGSVYARRRGLRAALAAPWTLAGLYAGAGAGATLYEIGIVGGNYNLLLDLLAPLCLVVGLSAGWLAGQIEQARPLAWVPAGGGAVALAAVLLAQGATFTDPHTWYLGGWPSRDRDNMYRGLTKIIARTPGDIYSEDAYLVLHSGRRVIYDDPSTFPDLARLGRWDDAVFNQSVRDRRFALIFLWRGSVRWTEAGLQALQANYDLVFPDSIDTYMPKLLPDTPQYALDCTLARDDDAVALEGYSLGPGVAWRGVRAGEVLHLALIWRARRALRYDYASFAHLVTADGHAVAGRDNPVTGAPQPPTAWPPGQVVTDHVELPIPAGVQPGRYRLVTGMYYNDGHQLWPLAPTCARHPDLVMGDALAPGWVEVTSP